MLPAVKAKLLEGKKGLIVGIANDRSIAWGCAKAFRALGAELAVTYLNDKAKKFVNPLAQALEAFMVPTYAVVNRLAVLGKMGCGLWDILPIQRRRDGWASQMPN